MAADPPYYDHEQAYQRITARGGHGWDDLYGDGEDPDSYAAVEAFLASPHAPAAGARVLDVGCGGGQVALRCARRGYVVTAVDFSPTAVALARGNARLADVQIDFAVADATKLGGLVDESFDLVIDNHMLHCLVERAHRDAFLARARALLTPGGLLFSDTMCADVGFDPAVINADPVTRIALSGNRVWVIEPELDAELARHEFQILHRQMKPPLPHEPGVGGSIATVARRH